MRQPEIKFVQPKNPQVRELAINCTSRYLKLDSIRKIKGLCKWCMSSVSDSRRHYCSYDCRKSAMAFCYPQRWGRDFLMDRQGGKCAHCEYDFNSKIKKFEVNRKCLVSFDNKTKTPTYIDDIYEYDDMGDVDHIIPISQGGEALGLDNHQLLCKDCHKIKSIKERRNDTSIANTGA